MTTPNSVLAKTTMALAVCCGAGSVALFALSPVGSLRLVRTSWTEPGALWWDAALSLAFFLQHSGMIRPGFRARIAPVVPPRYHRALYSIASGIVLTMVVALWQPSPRLLFSLEGGWRWTAHVVSVLAIALFLWGAFALRVLDLFGLAPIRAYLRGTAEPAAPFVARGPYRWVRHPWYLGAILLIWSYPDLTSDRLLFNVLWTVWIVIGARLEEADLGRDFGSAYDDYRRAVPMLIPWRGRVRDWSAPQNVR